MTVRLAVLADAHGNLPALQAALADIAHRHVDIIYHLGDAVGIGPFPEEVLALLARHGVCCLLGNHDAWLAYGLPPREMWPFGEAEWRHQQWVREHVSPRWRAVVATWPPSLSLDFEGVRLYLCHYAQIPSGALADVPKQLTPAALDARFPVKADLVLFGHDHRRCDLVGARRYLNPGSLGCHQVATARYLCLELRAGSFAATFHAVPYDPLPVLTELEARQVPARDEIRRLFMPWA